jgi:hypothetical protein
MEELAKEVVLAAGDGITTDTKKVPFIELLPDQEEYKPGIILFTLWVGFYPDRHDSSDNE